MLRTEKDDISDELYDTVFEPFNEYMGNYYKENILNEYVSYYIAEAYIKNALTKSNLIQIFNEACESLCQVKAEDCDTKQILKILKDKYKLEIINENPIDIKELE